MKEQGYTIITSPPKVHCKVFEDNAGCLEMARLPKMRPRTKHLCVKLHHFREHMRKGRISIHKVPTELQLADIATKAQPEALFVSQRESILRWDSQDMSLADLKLDAKHLRACEIIRNLEVESGASERPKGLPGSPKGA